MLFESYILEDNECISLSMGYCGWVYIMIV
jgi:hypothetical protein